MRCSVVALAMVLGCLLTAAPVALAQNSTTPAATETTVGSPDPTEQDPSISGWVAAAAVGGAIGVLVLFIVAGRRSASPTTRPPRSPDTPRP